MTATVRSIGSATRPTRPARGLRVVHRVAAFGALVGDSIRIARALEAAPTVESRRRVLADFQARWTT